MYEDELPEMTNEEYTIWFNESWIDFVRMGYGFKFIYSTKIFIKKEGV